MKKLVKILVGVLIASVILLGSTLGVLYFGMGIDIFDRSGWDIDDEGQTRYLDYYGDPLLDWQLIDGNWYYFDPLQEGEMVTGWLQLGSSRYYMDENGIRLTGWLELPDGTYYISPSNGSVTTGWLDTEKGRYYLHQTSGRVTTGWLDYEGQRYYLDEDGLMSVGWLEMEEGRYFLDDDGTIVTGWIETSEGTCYLREPTGLAATGWLELDTGRHYLDENGYLCSGWTDTPEGRYYLSEDGQPMTGWIDTDEGRYYLDESGTMTVGWLEYEGNRYYFRENGIMAVGQVTLDDVNHFFTSTGAYVVLVNKWNPLPEDYQVDLVSCYDFKIDRSCYDALVQMLTDLKSVGYYDITSAYRSEATQQYLWDNRLQRYLNSGYSSQGALDKVSMEVAVPGTSEHHLGLAVDISAGDTVDAWLAENSWRYGFILRYPNGKTDLTGIIYEPWHFRYVGLELAQELYELDMCMEEYMNMLTATQQSVSGEDTASTEPSDAAA